MKFELIVTYEAENGSDDKYDGFEQVTVHYKGDMIGQVRIPIWSGKTIAGLLLATLRSGIQRREMEQDNEARQVEKP